MNKFTFILLRITDTFQTHLETIFTKAVVVFYDYFFWYRDCWRIMNDEWSFQTQFIASLKGLLLCHLKNSFADYLCIFLLKINIVLTVLQLIKWLRSNPWLALCSEPSDLIFMTVCPWKHLQLVCLFKNTITGQCSFHPKAYHSIE